MTETKTGVSSPGGINGLLLWQQVITLRCLNTYHSDILQPHPMYLAQLAYQASPTRKTLQKWNRVLTATADYLASYAWKNESSGYYDLGPP